MSDDNKSLADEQTAETQATSPVATGEPPAAANTSEENADADAEKSDAGAAKADDGDGLPPEEIDRLTEEIVAALKTVYDPEIPADIYELGLIYRVEIDDDRAVKIDMTLTAPGCPVAGEMPIWVENAVNSVPGVSGTTVKITFDPPWDQSRMSDEARLAIGIF